jgi:hypothetical protein
MNLANYFQKPLRWLRVRQAVGGLEISDTALRFAEWTGDKWITASLRLPPGLIEKGRVKDPGRFGAALKELHSQIVGSPKSKKVIGAVVSLGSVDIYSQTFSLPVIEGENLEKAIQLNIQMVSPVATAETYSGWQMVGEDKSTVRLEILSAFIKREVVDEIISHLRGANFLPRSLEPRGLSLTRVIRELGEGFDPGRSYLVLSLDENGLEILILRRAQLYFQYFTPWADIYGSEREISQEAFENVIVRSLHQVINFYRSHWSEPLGDIYLIVPGIKDEVARIISENFSLNILELQLKNIPATPDWFVALGAALRGMIPPAKDTDISLLGISAQEEFRREQILNFLGFWRVLTPASLGLLLAAFIFGEMFLLRVNKTLEMRTAEIIQNDRSAEIKNLQNQADEFNRSLALIRSALEQSRPRFEVAAKVSDLMRARGIVLVRFWDQGSSLPIILNGRAKTEADIRDFAAELGKVAGFQNLNLPLAEIRPSSDGVQFSVTFNFASSKAE